MILWENKENLKSLLELLEKNTDTSFYKEFFKDVVLSEVSSVEELPILERQDLVDTHPSERCYVDQLDVSFVAYTSGTTGGKPLITYISEVDDYHVEPAWGLDIRRALVVFPPLNKNFGGTFIQQCRQATHTVVPVFGDIVNMATSAYLADSMKCDALYATPSLAMALAPYMKEYGASEDIKFLAISGETIGDSKLESLHALYPEALIANLYASSEVGQFIMGPTKQMMIDKVSGFRLLEDSLVAAELIDGELVVTYSLNKAFPLVRYRTGDYFEVSEMLTEKYGEGSPVLTWFGKGGVDVVRVHGLEIRTGTVDDFFDSLLQKVELYQLHIFSGETPDSIILKLECVMDESAVAGIDLIRTDFLAHFKIDNVSSIQKALERGVVETVEVVLVKELSHISQKRRVLVSHIK